MSLETRLQQFLDYKRFNANDLAKHLKIAPSTLSKALTNKTLSTSKIPIAVLNAFDELSAEWFVRGKGEMIIENNQLNEPKQVYTRTPQSNILRIVEEEWEEVKQEIASLKERMKRLEGD